jgi:serine/threonine-protein kinase
MGYEMLTGHTPFPGLNPQQTLAAHVTQAPIPVAQQRAGLSPTLDATIMRCLAKRPADRFQTADELVTALEPLTASSGGITPTHTQPVPSLTTAPARKPARMYAIAGAAALALVAAVVALKPWARTAAKLLDANLVAVMPFRVAGADPSVQYLRQGMLDLLQAKLTGEGGARAAETRSVLAAVRDAGGTDNQDLDGSAVTSVARKLGAGRVLQGSIVGPPDHLVISATLLAMPGGSTVAQTSVTGPKDSLFVLIDRLTGQLLALGAGARENQLSALTTTNLDALRAYLDGVTAYRRGAFQEATPLLEKAVSLDSTFALALSALIEADGWHRSTGDMNRVRRLAWQYRDRLNPQDQLFLSLRLGSAWPLSTPWNVQIADAEKAVQKVPESADAWYYLGDALFHYGLLSDVPDAQVKARRAFEQAVQRDSLYGAPVVHLAALTYAAGDTAAQRLWTTRGFALDPNGESVNNARWQLLAATRNQKGIAAFLHEADSMPAMDLASIPYFAPTDSTTIAHQDELFQVGHRTAATKGEQGQTTYGHVVELWNRGRPAEAAAWLDTLFTINQGFAAIQSVVGAASYGGARPDSSRLTPAQLDFLRLQQGDTAAGRRVLAVFRERAAKDTLQTDWFRIAPLTEAMLAVKRGDPAAEQLVDLADSLWRGREVYASWASIQLARLYQAQGRTDRALRAVRRRWLPLGQPEPAGLAESYRLEGQLAAKIGDRQAAIAAYKNYLRLRFDPDSSRMPQRDSVRAEYAAIADVEKQKQ